jgi:hypothetical protein
MMTRLSTTIELPVVERLLELHRHLLPLCVVARVLDLTVELRVELRLVTGQRAIGVDENRQVREVGLIDVADVGEVGRDDARRHPRSEQRCSRENNR